MNLVGKIFVGLILIMSLVFATLSIMVYATHKNWREEILRTPAEVRGNQRVGYKHQLEQAYQEMQRLASEKAALTLERDAERAAKIQALAKAEATIQALATERRAAQDQLAAKEAELAANTEALRVMQENLSHLTGEVRTLRDEIASANRETDEQIKKATALTDKLAVASGQLAVLKERNEQLAKDVTNARNVLKSLGRTAEDPVDANAIRVDGQITGVSRERVELSIGIDDGVRVGQDLDVYRGDKYLGRVRVIEVRADKAVATILPEFQQLPIQRGDNVSSRLKA